MRRFDLVRGALLAGCAALTAACASTGEGAPRTAQARPAGEQSADPVRAAAAASNAFALDLYRAVAQPGDNLFVSPASVSLAVGFAYRGAAGQTAAELRQVMHFPDGPTAYLRAAGALDRQMALSAPGRELRSANALWVREDIALRPDYEADMAAHARAGLQRADFQSDPEGARRAINRWVADQTAERIAELIGEGVIRPTTGAVLVNAIYWKGDWAQPFAPADSKTEPFTRLDGSQLPTRLMTQQGAYRVLERRGVKAIELPYKGDEVSMVVLLPDDPGGLARLERGLTAERLAEWLEALDAAAPRDTILTLPAMRLDWAGDLATVIAGMGAPTPFSAAADFSGMAQLPVPGGDPAECGLAIANVIHQANIDVDEAGSEAAAATAVVMGVIVTSARRGPPPPPPFVFRADRPFFFVLRDRRSGLVLFAGRLLDPAQSRTEGPAAREVDFVAEGGCARR